MDIDRLVLPGTCCHALVQSILGVYLNIRDAAGAENKLVLYTAELSAYLFRISYSHKQLLVILMKY